MYNKYKKKKDPVENRKLILEAVVDLANNLELSQISFDALAKKCGLSKGGIIHHFPNKESVFDTLFKESFEEYKNWIGEELQSKNLKNPAIALISVAIRNSNEEGYRRLTKVIFKCLVNNEQYSQLWKEWFAEYIIKDLYGDTEIATLLGSLVAIGMWNLEALGLYTIEIDKKHKILSLLQEKHLL